MATKVLTSHDFSKNEIQNARIQNLAAAPGSPVEGQVYHDTTLHQLGEFDGTAWHYLKDSWVATVGASAPITSSGGANPTIAINGATGATAGSMSAADKTKLDAATAASTASTLVLRDASSNFTANVITATTVTGLSTPVGANDAANKTYVDNLINGTDWKASCRAGTTANITLSGTQTVDGVAVIAGDRVLVKNQTTASGNGIYVVAAGAWTRPADAAQGTLTANAAVYVSEGTTQADTQWQLQTNDPITVGTTGLTWAQIGAGTSYTGGVGITVAGNSIAIDTAWPGQAAITTLGTITTGTWTGTTIAVANGGTGATTASGARANLGTSGKYSALIGDGASTSYTITQATHGLASNGQMLVATYDATTGARVYPDESINNANGTVTIAFNTAPATNSYRVVLVG